MIRRPPRSTQSRSSAASDVYKRQSFYLQWAQHSVCTTISWPKFNTLKMTEYHHPSVETQPPPAPARQVPADESHRFDLRPSYLVSEILMQLRPSLWLLRCSRPVSYTHLRAHETVLDLVCRLLLEKKKKKKKTYLIIKSIYNN
eukprot:TRINITY_DN1629_c0_g1_i1.p1 TRINITY_DN1629_c0_g1~~TRINITY_DN1629_c0_g1_i1.p1  ORF type:complete len:144 (+),score=50.93 TRINITY_DN1629_c0_g1_i1:96-527(+)